MPFGICSIGGEKVRRRVASFYWSTWAGDGSREAWKQKYCHDHYDSESADWLDAARAAWDADGSRNCFLCEEARPEELVEYYATAFVPGQLAERFGVSACLKHVKALSTKARHGGDPLPNREGIPYAEGGSTSW